MNKIMKHITCESHDYERKECPVEGKVKQIVGIQRQTSGSQDCTLGETYGNYEDRIWVNSGCKATFLVVVEDGKCVCSRVKMYVIFLK
jgi:hypothetical protein